MSDFAAAEDRMEFLLTLRRRGIMDPDVLRALRRFEIEERANVPEGAHRRARAATAALHEARSRIAMFLNANSPD